MKDDDNLEEYAARMRVFLPNRQAFPLEELMKYEGQWIAWNPEGTAIVASSSESAEVVYELVIAAGYDPSRCVFDYIPDPNCTHLGGPR